MAGSAARAGAPTTLAVSELSAGERAAVYRWLAGLFAREQTVESLRHYRSAEGRALLGALGEIAPLAPAAESVARSTTDIPEADLPGRALDLAGDFARLFLGVGGRRTVPPYQSFYSSPEGRVMQAPAAAMQGALRQRNRRLAEAFPEPPDHLAVQLSMLAELVETAPAAEQAAFLDTRLLGWIGEFAARCAAADRTGFYAVAARALADFAVADRAALAADFPARDACG